MTKDGAVLSKQQRYGNPIESHYSQGETIDFQKRIHDLHTEYWHFDYRPKTCFVLDGEEWTLTFMYSSGQKCTHCGINAYPHNWNELLDIIGIDQANNEY